jgi:hypothetical protein
MTDLAKMWAALSAHKPKPKYAKAWRRMCKERTPQAADAASDAAWAAGSAVAADAAAAAWTAMVTAKAAAEEAADAIRYINKAEEPKP